MTGCQNFSLRGTKTISFSPTLVLKNTISEYSLVATQKRNQHVIFYSEENVEVFDTGCYSALVSAVGTILAKKIFAESGVGTYLVYFKYMDVRFIVSIFDMCKQLFSIAGGTMNSRRK